MDTCRVSKEEMTVVTCTYLWLIGAIDTTQLTLYYYSPPTLYTISHIYTIR